MPRMVIARQNVGEPALRDIPVVPDLCPETAGRMAVAMNTAIGSRRTFFHFTTAEQPPDLWIAPPDPSAFTEPAMIDTTETRDARRMAFEQMAFEIEYGPPPAPMTPLRTVLGALFLAACAVTFLPLAVAGVAAWGLRRAGALLFREGSAP